MSLYKSNIVEGTEQQYRRCFVFRGVNPFRNIPTPYIEFYEQDVTITPTGQVFTVDNVDKVTALFDNPLDTFPLLNPEDNSVIGSMSRMDLFIAIYSLYFYEAQQRDMNIENSETE